MTCSCIPAEGGSSIATCEAGERGEEQLQPGPKGGGQH